MRYGEDSDPPRRVRKIEDLHAQEVLLRGAIIEEFRAVFNLASLFADALAVVVPDHPYIAVARYEGMLGNFEIKEKNEIPVEVVTPSVPSVHEGGLLPVSVPKWHTDTGAGSVHDPKASSVGDSVAQGSRGPHEEGLGDGGSNHRSGRGEQISFGWGSGEALAGGGVSGVGESSK